jgi:sensor histidine kinase YesM
MAILHLSSRPSEPCIFAIFEPTIFNLRIIIEDYVRIKEMFVFFDSFSINSGIALGLGPSQIKIFLNYMSSLFEDFFDPF